MPQNRISITVARVAVSLAKRPALRDVSWSLHGGTAGEAGLPSEHWAVLGENGAGKSTFLRLLRGDVRPDQDAGGNFIGRVLWNVDGEADASPLVIKPVSRLVSAEQHRNYVRKGWEITGKDMILSGFADTLLPTPAKEEQHAAAEALAVRFGITPLLEKAVTAMSQGQFRLILLAKSMIGSPKLLLLDEPFDGLDHAARGMLHAAIGEIAREATVICTAHREGDIPACITHALRLSRGVVVSAEPMRTATQTMQDNKARPAQTGGNAEKFDASRNGKYSIPYALELRNVDVYVNRAKVLHSLTWKLPLGESWRIAGPNGSGKSTLLRLVAGFEHAALGGKFLWFGREHPPLETRLKETGYLSDFFHATYRYDITGLELVYSGFDGTVGVWRKPTRKEDAEAKRWLDLLDLVPVAGVPLSRLSSGMARRFFLARALAGSPRLLLLDEPCSGLDETARKLFIASLETVIAQGVQCLYVSHNADDVPLSVLRTLFLDRGRITGES